MVMWACYFYTIYAAKSVPNCQIFLWAAIEILLLLTAVFLWVICGYLQFQYLEITESTLAHRCGVRHGEDGHMLGRFLSSPDIRQDSFEMTALISILLTGGNIFTIQSKFRPLKKLFLINITIYVFLRHLVFNVEN